MNVLEEYDKRKGKDCTVCKNHTTRNNGKLHFCTASGKILLYPLYLPSNCVSWRDKE